MGKKSFDPSENQSYTDLEHCKRLLRVRGIEEVGLEILQKESELETVIREARSYHEACSHVDLVANVTYLSKGIKYQHMEAPERFHVPFLVFSSQVALEHRPGKFQRKDHYKWEEISKMLDDINASLDERLIHMRIFFAFKNFYYRGRQVAEDLRVLYRLKFEFDSMLEFEHMAGKNLPKFMIQAIV